MAYIRNSQGYLILLALFAAITAAAGADEEGGMRMEYAMKPDLYDEIIYVVISNVRYSFCIGIFC